ncbi:hypothetical protein LINPERHAP2_LOCUS5682 [Linum perenne]|jgi:hypothetical protein
MDFL